MNAHLICEPEFLSFYARSRLYQLQDAGASVVRGRMKQEAILGAPHRRAYVDAAPGWDWIFPQRPSGVRIEGVHAVAGRYDELSFAVEGDEQRSGRRYVGKAPCVPNHAAVLLTERSDSVVWSADHRNHPVFIGDWACGIAGLHRPAHLVRQRVVFLYEAVRPEQPPVLFIEREKLLVG